MFGIGLGQNFARRPATAGLNYAAIFAGTAGVFIGAAEQSTLFQDAAGTTPVTAAGQFVGLAKDQSGNAFDFNRATAGQLPAYQVVNGKPHFLFDGSDDRLVNTGSIAGNTQTIMIACEATGTNGTANSVYSMSVSASDLLLVSAGAASVGSAGTYGAYTNPAVKKSRAGLDGPQVLFMTIDKVAGTMVLEQNGVAATGSSGSNNSSTLGSRIGSTTANTFFFAGKVFAVFQIARALSANEKSAIIADFKARSGASF